MYRSFCPFIPLQYFTTKSFFFLLRRLFVACLAWPGASVSVVFTNFHWSDNSDVRGGGGNTSTLEHIYILSMPLFRFPPASFLLYSTRFLNVNISLFILFSTSFYLYLCCPNDELEKDRKRWNVFRLYGQEGCGHNQFFSPPYNYSVMLSSSLCVCVISVEPCSAFLFILFSDSRTCDLYSRHHHFYYYSFKALSTFENLVSKVLLAFALP